MQTTTFYGEPVGERALMDTSRQTLCRCGRPRATVDDLVRFRRATTAMNPYRWSPSTWQKVMLGLCIGPGTTHNEIRRDFINICWSLICESLPECKLPAFDPLIEVANAIGVDAREATDLATQEIVREGNKHK